MIERRRCRRSNVTGDGLLSTSAVARPLDAAKEPLGALSPTLRAIPLLLAQHRKGSTLPDFTALRAMLFYVDEFPEKRHHRKESELLFRKLRARTPLSRPLLDHLDGDHAAGERNIREPEHALLGIEMLCEPRREAFETAAARYLDFYLAHTGLEEREILPLAEKVLTVEARAELDEAFLANEDRLGACRRPMSLLDQDQACPHPAAKQWSDTTVRSTS